MIKTAKYEISLPELPEEIRETHMITFWYKFPSQAEAKDAYGLGINAHWESAAGMVWLGIAAVPKPWTLADEADRPLPFAVRTRSGDKGYIIAYMPDMGEYPWCVRYADDTDGNELYAVDAAGCLVSSAPGAADDIVGLWEDA